MTPRSAHAIGNLVDITLGEDDGVFILDGSDEPKQGKMSVGVKRQHCGQLGKKANCQAGVFLGYASRKGYTLVDCRLYLPQEWLTDEVFTQLRTLMWCTVRPRVYY